MQSYTLKELSVGEQFERNFEVTEELGEVYAGVSQDYNPLHLDEEYAKTTRFKGRIAHGMLAGGFISAIIGSDFPGEGSVYLKQDMTFTCPVRYGDTIRVVVTVKEIIPEKNRVILETDCFNQDGKQVIAGEALVMPKEDK